MSIRNHVIDMFERSEDEPPSPARQAMLTFVVAGGGFAGAELAGSLNDFARGMLVYYPNIAPEEVRVILVHSRERILPELSEERDRIVLTPQKFYLLMSDEAVSIPSTLAANMTAYDPTSGELRTHYAGFFDPGFGYDPEISAFTGSRAALEVRAHDVPFAVEHGQNICKLSFERMIEPPDRLYGYALDSNYQGQEVALSKHFKTAKGS